MNNKIKRTVFMLCLALVFVLAGCAKGDDSEQTETTVQETAEEKDDTVDKLEEEEKADNAEQKEDNTAETQEIAAGGSLAIPVSELSGTVRFYPVTVDEVDMEVLAVKDAEGNIRTAFNTCQVCYSSGRGYYKQVGDRLVCQNCGNQFTVDQIEVLSGGCNPLPIFSEDKTETADSVTINYDFLKEVTQVFANWKASY
ncbi:DUF2318 domain-containing protein [Clostridium sp. C105KSO13]|uniref:DUF2318 domain-containing protein n=1 Tax=Clostridium sp. C105KSO13 TaxID=1776045 RepID=UPI0007405E4B|nr:DUF2318 domain-containing protein [Clostridium sp. C105KSO13]CUX46443.1 hypothetical protein BN3456_02602 [Clostridium sp. C105KSO13]